MAYFVDGTQRSAVPADRALFAETTRQCQPYESARYQCDLYVAEHGCKWRGLPERFGNWHTICTRMNRWSKSGVLDRIFEQLQHAQIVRIKIEAVSLDSTMIKVHPDGTGTLKKTALKPSVRPAGDGPPRFILLPRMLERP